MPSHCAHYVCKKKCAMVIKTTAVKEIAVKRVVLAQVAIARRMERSLTEALSMTCLCVETATTVGNARQLIVDQG